MKGTITSFRRGRHTYKPRHFIISVEGIVKRDDALKLIGKTVEWTSPAGNIIKGKVSAAHGNKGLVRVIFERGLPGQAVNCSVKVK